VKHKVPHTQVRIRLRQYLPHVFPLIQSNAGAKKAISKCLILVNGQVATSETFIVGGDVIGYIVPQRQQSAEEVKKLKVHYEDDHLAIIWKPAGVTSSGGKTIGAADRLAVSVKPSTAEDSLAVPLLVHRLDFATSGLMIAAKRMSTRIRLGEMLATNAITKIYHAIVKGELKNLPLTVNQDIDGVVGITHLVESRLLSTADVTSLVKVKLETGRTHQIRRHLKSIQHPIVGDNIYNSEGLTFRRGLFLSCTELGFKHPVIGDELNISVNLPIKFQKYIRD